MQAQGLNGLRIRMVNLRRKHIDVTKERRNKTRIEFHLPVVILGVDDKAQIIDFSPEGFKGAEIQPRRINP